MTVRPIASLTVLLTLAVSGSAAAAQIETDRACYPAPAKGSVAVAVSANGLDPSQPYAVTMDGKAVTGGTTDATGGVTATIAVPRLSSRHDSQSRTLVITEGANTATTTFGIARLKASFSPAVGSPARLRVRFSGTGFALQKANPTVYLHEVDPTGHVARTLSLGRATGPCGTIAANRTQKLFATPPHHGRWRLQFDTSRSYRRGRSSFLYYTLEVTVSR